MASFIEFPIFTGVAGELRSWISELEDFFVRKRFTAEEKMNLAQSLLEGVAEAWFYSNQRILIFQSWEELKDHLLLRFGDFADSDRIRLIAEQDRFLKEIEDEARIQRMKTTSIPAKDSIWETETEALVPTDTIPVMNWTESRESSSTKESIEKDESSSAKDESITQNQVPVSSLEPGLSFSSEILDVLVAWPSEMVSNNRVHSQAGFECVKNKNNAHHVLDELLLRQHKFQQRKKPSLSPKSPMFKFKNRTLLSNWSQMDLHQVIDISKVNNLSPCFSANFGLVRKKRTFQCLRLSKQAHMSRVLYQMRMLHDPGGMQRLLHGDMKPMAVKPMGLENQTPAVFRMAISSFCPLFSEETSKPWGIHMTFTSKPVASVNSLSFEVVTEENMFRGLSQTSQVWEPGGVAANVLVDWLLLLEFVLFIHLEDKVCLSGASNSWCGWLVFDRGKNNKWDVHVDSLIVRIKVILSCGVALRKQIQWAEIQKLSLYKEFWIEIMDGDITKLLNSTGGKHTVSAWELYLSCVSSTVTSANSGWLQGLIEQVFQGDDEAYTKIFDKLQLNLKQGMDLYRASGHRLFLHQQSSSSIWHRWRRKMSVHTSTILLLQA